MNKEKIIKTYKKGIVKYFLSYYLYILALVLVYWSMKTLSTFAFDKKLNIKENLFGVLYSFIGFSMITTIYLIMYWYYIKNKYKEIYENKDDK